MRSAVKRALALMNPMPEAAGCRVLLYHAVGAPSSEDRLSLRVSPMRFREQMVWLRDHGWRVVPLRNLVEGGAALAGRTVAITFDDGYKSQLEAIRILKEFGFPATLFVVPQFLDGECSGSDYWERWDHFGWSELIQLSSEGFEIGAHSNSHVRLTGCSLDQLQDETAGAKSRLEAHLGQQVTSFSYPHGMFDRVVVRAVQEAGYRLACTSIYGAVRAPGSWFLLRRIEIRGKDQLRDFQMKLLGKYDWLASWQRWQAHHA